MTTKMLYTPAEANVLIQSGDAVLVDVRDPEAYVAGHIQGAVNIPEMFSELSMTTPEGIQEMVDVFAPLLKAAGIRKDQRCIVYEDCLHSRYGGSCRGFFQLSLFGHPHVGILDGGLSQWLADGFSVTAEPTVREPSDFQVELQTGSLATLDDVKRALDDPSLKLLDNRDSDEWRGISSSPYGIDFAPRKGRIPGARWIEWYDFMTTGEEIPHFKGVGEIREICDRVGLGMDDDIIVYCFKGARASNTHVALRLAGFENVRNYYGSWNEWSRQPELPIDDTVLVA
jgi:thiosulfate/3-mercaptopyruvate sulfurtransferase